MTKDELFDALKRSILTLEFRPSEDLDELELCRWAGLSRTPLREVLQRLAGEGYVSLRRNRGACVSAMTLTTLRDFFPVASVVYGSIHRLAALHASDEQLDALRAAQHRCRSTGQHGSAGERTLANHRFHEITGHMADNVYLLPSFSRLLIDHARIGVTFFDPREHESPKRIDRALDQHDAIIDAIAARDPDAAALLAVEHMDLARGRVERLTACEGSQIDAELERVLQSA